MQEWRAQVHDDQYLVVHNDSGLAKSGTKSNVTNSTPTLHEPAGRGRVRSCGNARWHHTPRAEKLGWRRRSPRKVGKTACHYHYHHKWCNESSEPTSYPTIVFLHDIFYSVFISASSIPCSSGISFCTKRNIVTSNPSFCSVVFLQE